VLKYGLLYNFVPCIGLYGCAYHQSYGMRQHNHWLPDQASQVHMYLFQNAFALVAHELSDRDHFDGIHAITNRNPIGDSVFISHVARGTPYDVTESTRRGILDHPTGALVQ
jgi:hypothetical protein